MTRSDVAILRMAADRLDTLMAGATPGPWRVSLIDGNRYGAVVSDAPHPGRTHGPDEGYGGYLVVESCAPGDQAFLPVLRGAMAPLLVLFAEEADRLSTRTADVRPSPHLMEAAYTVLGVAT